MRFLMLNWRDPENPLAGGAERVTQAYLKALVDRGHEAWWFSFDFPGAKPETVIDGVHIVRGGDKGSAIFKAKAWYKQQPRFNLVIDQHHGIPWYAPWWCGTNNIAYIHEVLGPIWDAFYKWPISAIGRAQERWTHWCYRDVPFFTASSDTKRQLHEHGVKDVTIIPYGVHTRALPELPVKPLVTPYKLIVVSRLAPNKRIDHAVLTHKCLRERGVNTHLTVVGGGEMDEKLKAIVAEHSLQNCTRFTGPLPEAEKDALLRDSHFLLHTSQREGWGLNVIEANAMGTPGAVYAVPGLVESTLDNETGVLAKAETPESLADRLVEAFKSEEHYQQWRVNGWNRAKTFHWDSVLPKACDWLEQMAQGKGNRP